MATLLGEAPLRGRYRALMRVDHMPNHTQADAAATHLRVDGSAPTVERFEHVRKVGGVNPETTIDDTDLYRVRLCGGCHVDCRSV